MNRFAGPVLAKYRIGFLDLLLGMTATLAVLCYSLYTVTGHHGNATLVITVPLVTYGVIRYLLLVTVNGEGEAPEKLLVTDRFLLGTAAHLGGLLRAGYLYRKFSSSPNETAGASNHQDVITPVEPGTGNNPAFCSVALEATFDALHRAAGILPIS